MVSIFVVGFPKSGTTTLQTAFARAGLKSVHWRQPGGALVGQVIYEDFNAGRDPLRRLTQYDCIAQADVCRPDLFKNGVQVNYWPQLDFEVLQAIEAFHPDMRFLLNRRDVAALIRSITNWGTLRTRITEMEIPGLPAGIGGTDDELEAWITGHYTAADDQFSGNPHYLGFDIADPATHHLLEDFLGVRLPWWGIANVRATVPPPAADSAGAATGDDASAPAAPHADSPDVQERILAAALALSAAGDGDFTFAQLAEATGTSLSTLRRRFPNREALDAALGDVAPTPVLTEAELDDEVPAELAEPVPPEPVPAPAGTPEPVAATPAAPDRLPAESPRLPAGAARVPGVLGILDRVPPHLVADQIVAEAQCVAGVAVALYVLAQDGVRMLRVSGSPDLPESPNPARALSPELVPERLGAVEAHLREEFPAARVIPMRMRGRLVGALVTVAEPLAALDAVAREGAMVLELAGDSTDLGDQANGQPRSAMQRRPLAPRIMHVTRAAVSGGVLPGRMAGGDWFDIADNADGTWLAAADPDGTGPGSVGLGLAALGALRGARHAGGDVAAVAAAMHEEIAAVGDGAVVRAFLARWHAPTATLAWVNCGYPPVHLVTLEHGLGALKGPTYPALGAGGDAPRYGSRLARLEGGDRLVVASDGMLARSGRDDLRRGVERLRRLVARTSDPTAAATLAEIQHTFTGRRQTPDDDATVVVLSVD